jgi:hypothetical protein
MMEEISWKLDSMLCIALLLAVFIVSQSPVMILSSKDHTLRRFWRVPESGYQSEGILQILPQYQWLLGRIRVLLALCRSEKR